MNIIAVDDELLALNALERTIPIAAPEANLVSFSSSEEALEYAQHHPVDIAFLDVEMPVMNGLMLALKLKELDPRINIIFVTGFANYMGEAFSQHVSGYVLKPVDSEAIAHEIENLRYPVESEYEGANKRIRVQCFGNFEVFVDEERLVITSARARELLAYLVDRKGAGVRAAEIASVLWEDQAYTRSRQQQVQGIISTLMKTLNEKGLEGLVVRTHNNIAIDPTKIDCDYYRFLEGDVVALNSYAGEYMSNYSWAELTTGYLSSKVAPDNR